jgi:transposase
MSSAIPLCADFDGPGLRVLAKGTRDPVQLRRLLALAEIYDGGCRGDAARVGGVGLQTVRDWVLRFNAGGAEALVDPKTAGRKSKLNAARRRALVRVVEDGPLPSIHGVVRWRLKDLTHWVREEFNIVISVQSLSRELRALGYRKLSARPRHYAQDVEALAAFKKTSPPRWRRSPNKRPRART